MGGNIAVLGSTGSIGKSALDIIDSNRDKFRVKSLAAGNNTELLKKQIADFSPELVTVATEEGAEEIRREFPGLKVYHGMEGLLEAVNVPGTDTLLSAIDGTTPLRATVEAIKKGYRICLANKETLVAAGEFINSLLEEYDSELIPIDSEQSAVFQALGNKSEAEGLRKIVLTASGGPFFRRAAEDFADITVKDALNHPTWSMGRKITIDSATMMNKALEVIEAKYLFNLEPEQIDTIIHPQSIVHSMVEYIDGSVIAQLSVTDMRIPILFSFSYPERVEFPGMGLNLAELTKLEFYPTDKRKFPSLDMAYRVLRKGGTAGAVFNAANEVAVDEFIKGNIGFTGIFELVDSVLESTEIVKAESIDHIEDVIVETKKRAEETARRRFNK